MSSDKQGGLSVHPYVGGTTTNLVKNVINNGGVNKQMLPSFALTLLGTLCLSPVRAWERLVHGRAIANTKLQQDPVFIIGHWRSGTTHLHNVMSQDDRFGYLSTLHALFPTCAVTLGKSQVMKNLLAGLLPEKRMMDNVKMALDYPQEEEFSVSCITTHSHHCNYFPSTIRQSFDKYVLFDVDDKGRQQWKKAYLETIRKISYTTGGKRLILKNPYNTARIPILLEMFPNAKFIHIYRNPYNIYVSALHDFIREAEEMALQDFSEDNFASICYELYQKLMTRYWETKHLVPKGNLAEVAFEAFEQQPLLEIKRIYQELELDLNPAQERNITDYLASLSDYRRNQYTYSASLAAEIKRKWGFALDKMQYSLPPDIAVSNDADWSCKM